METLLTRQWLGDEDDDATIAMRDDASLSVARERVRAAARTASMSKEDIELAATVMSELGRNQLRHGYRGVVRVAPITRDGVAGIEIVAADAGKGIADPRKAFEGKARREGSLGVGLRVVREHSAELDVDVRIGEGTAIRARAFASKPIRRRETGIFGRALPSERTSGDHALVVRHGDRLSFAVCDGLGHGEKAREAADAAIGAWLAAGPRAPHDLVEICDRALRGTRGAVMTIGVLDERTNELHVAAVGNVLLHVYEGRAAKRVSGSSFVLGAPASPARRITEERLTLGPHATIVCFTDGVTSRLSLEAELDLLREAPIAIAERVVRDHARDNDDALVLVVR